MDNIENSCFEKIEELDIELESQQMTDILVKNNLKHLESEKLRILMENAWLLVEKINGCRDAHARTVVSRSIREYLLEAYGWKSPFGRIDFLAYVMHLRYTGVIRDIAHLRQKECNILSDVLSALEGNINIEE